MENRGIGKVGGMNSGQWRAFEVAECVVSGRVPASIQDTTSIPHSLQRFQANREEVKDDDTRLLRKNMNTSLMRDL